MFSIYYLAVLMAAVRVLPVHPSVCLSVRPFFCTGFCKVVKCVHYILVRILTGWRRTVVSRLYYASITLACFLVRQANSASYPSWDGK